MHISGEENDDEARNKIESIDENRGGRKLEYGRIATECAVRLQNGGYLLDAGDMDYMNEVAIMMLSDHADENLTEDQMIELVMSEGRTFLKHSNEIDLMTQNIRYRGYHLNLKKRFFRRTGWYIEGFSEGYRTLADARAEIDEWGLESSDDTMDTSRAL